MKTKQVKLFLGMLAVVLFAWALNSCSKSNDAAPVVSKTALNDSIEVATALLAGATEGIQDGQYAVGSKVTLAIAIGEFTELASLTTATQAQVNAATAALGAAMATFRAGKVVPVAASALVAHWGFEEGTGLTTADASANAFNGTLKAGPTQWGAKKPVWISDRHGSGKALQFNNGASVEVPYNTKLNPTSVTMAAWVRVDTVYANNRFIGLETWMGYKFQLQDGNRPFATIATSTGIYDRDAAVGIPDDKQWHHLVMTYVDGTETFYIDGVNVKVWNDVTGTGLSISATPFNLVLGADYPVDKYCSCDGSNFDNAASPEYHVVPLAWGGHFIGALDEIRIYNTALTASQVTSIYDREK